MSAAEIVTRLFTAKEGITPAQVVKARSLATRQRVDWSLVLEAMTEAQRKQVHDASQE